MGVFRSQTGTREEWREESREGRDRGQRLWGRGNKNEGVRKKEYEGIRNS
jgi:hypothetical protein